jgi:hypothetical protein
MKKLVIAVLAVASLALVACKKEEKPAPAPATSPAGETKPTESPAASPAASPAESPAASPAAGGAASTGVPECDEYMAKAEKCFQSDKWPAAARDAAKQGFEQSKAAWAGLADAPAEAKKAAADACKQATDAMKQGGEMMCPGVF